MRRESESGDTMTELLKISLPDGSVREVPRGSTPADIAAAIDSAYRASDALAAAAAAETASAAKNAVQSKFGVAALASARLTGL
mgnify:CR=1 FL=1